MLFSHVRTATATFHTLKYMSNCSKVRQHNFSGFPPTFNRAGTWNECQVSSAYITHCMFDILVCQFATKDKRLLPVCWQKTYWYVSLVCGMPQKQFVELSWTSIHKFQLQHNKPINRFRHLSTLHKGCSISSDFFVVLILIDKSCKFPFPLIKLPEAIGLVFSFQSQACSKSFPHLIQFYLNVLWFNSKHLFKDVLGVTEGSPDF